MKILITGCAGFIGMHVTRLLLERGEEVIGIDNLNDYYDPGLKYLRLEQLNLFNAFTFIKLDLSNFLELNLLFAKYQPRRVINLAAQAGVRYSLQNPDAYIQSNIVGFANILELCRKYNIEHLVYASSSSVYGANSKIPFSESDTVDNPVSLYAASKKSNELMAHSYSHLYGLTTTGLRYFTVYGPWGRPDMSPWLFTSSILEGRTIDVYNYGEMKRDFTYIDDIAMGTVKVLDRTVEPNLKLINSLNSNFSLASYRIYNIGNNKPIPLMEFIKTIELALGVDAKKNFLPLQPGDVITTYADISYLQREIGFEPSTHLTEGIENWVNWYKSYIVKK